jgi:ribulose-5-phosphate 4-epimerase/fuculose-1-phosphate aldolase
MATSEADLRHDICTWGRSLFERGLSPGSSGNLSVRIGAFALATPTGSCLGQLEPEQLTKLGLDGELLSGPMPTKEWPLHREIYLARPDATAVVHLHSSYATALSCIEPLQESDVLARLTPYPLMQFGRVPRTPYAAPGSDELARHVADAARQSSAIIMANHGSVVAASSLRAAVFAAEELEEAAKLFFLTAGHGAQRLSDADAAWCESFRLGGMK